MLQTTFEVTKNAFDQYSYCQQQLPDELAPEHIIISVDKFALTANNISYAVMGDYLGYWQFFPASQRHVGRVPVMGYGTVTKSNHPDINVGERLWGFFPMANMLSIHAGKVSRSGFYDMNPSRANLAPLYSFFERVNNSPTYQQAYEDFDILLRGLYTTAWLIEDYFFDHQYFGAHQYLVTSASSKTSIALAFAIKARGEKPAIGITSKSRVDYVKSLNCYHDVISYEDVKTLESTIPTVLVDMAGNKDVLASIHRYFNNQLKYSCRVGATHFQQVDMNQTLEGPEPQMFFAPHQMQKRSNDWGREALLKKMASSFFQFIKFSEQQFKLEHLTVNNNDSAQEFAKRYLSVLSGSAESNVGFINKIEHLG